VAKVLASLGLWVAAVYTLKTAWGLLKIEVLVAAIMNYAVNVAVATGATNKWAAATMFLTRGFWPMLAIGTALYAAYSLLASAKAENVEVDDKFLEVTKKRHAEERKELVTIRDLVSAVRDETASEVERSIALLKLQKLTGELNLKINESTRMVENQTGAIEEHAEKFDDWADAVGTFDNRAEVEGLLDSIKLHEESNDALTDQIKLIEETKRKAAAFAEEGSTWFGLMARYIRSMWDPLREYQYRLSFMGKEIENQEEGYRKLADTAIKSHGDIQKVVLGLSSMTQEVWLDQMVAAGASYDEIESLVTDATGKITKEQLKMYLDIQAASDGFTETEKKNIAKAILEFTRLTNTKQSELQRGLAAIREVYAEQEAIVTKVYDQEILRLKRQPDLTSRVYDDMLNVINAKIKKKKELLEASYQAELALIKETVVDRAKLQGEIDELNKKTENRRIDRAKEVAEILRSLAEDALGILTSNYERETAIYNTNIDKRIASIDRYYEHEKAKAALSEENAAILGKTLSNIEAQRLENLMAVAEETNLQRLANEQLYHEKYILIVKASRTQAQLQFEEGSDKLIEAEQALNDKLIEIDRSSAETRMEIIQDWGNYLEGKYDEAISKAREYGNKTIEFENDIRDIRKKAAEAIVSAVESTEDKVLRVRRAGMTKIQLVWSKAYEAHRKMIEANRLVTEVGTAEALTQAGKLYGEVEDIYTDLGVQSQQAAKEGKAIGISFAESTKGILAAGKGKLEALKATEKLAIKAKQAELDAAKQAQKSWADLAGDIKEKVLNIQEDIENLTGLVGGVVSSINSIEDKEVDVGADEALLNRSIRLVGDLWTNIDKLKDKVVKVTVDYTENRKAGGLIGKKFDSGGAVPGSGSGDTVPAMLTPGEFVIPKNRVAQFGLDFMESIRSGMLSVGDFLKFGLGGIVKAAEPAVSTLFPSANMTDLIPSLTKAIDRLGQASSTAGFEEETTSAGGKYDFNLNIGGATLKGAASKSVLERFKVDLRRLERAGGLA
jgi:hypothetical protein